MGRHPSKAPGAHQSLVASLLDKPMIPVLRERDSPISIELKVILPGADPCSDTRALQISVNPQRKPRSRHLTDMRTRRVFRICARGYQQAEQRGSSISLEESKRDGVIRLANRDEAIPSRHRKARGLVPGQAGRPTLCWKPLSTTEMDRGTRRQQTRPPH